MSTRQKQIQAMQDGNEGESYEFMNHRGGGGAPLISARSGNQVAKIGQVINGSKQIDVDKYNGIGSIGNMVDRPKTAFDHRTPSAVGSDGHDLFTPTKSLNSNPTGAADQNRYRKKQDRVEDVRQSLPSSHFNRRESSGMASLLSDASSYCGSEAPEPIRTKLNRMEEEQPIQSRNSPQHADPTMPRIHQRQARNLVNDLEQSPQLLSVPSQPKNSAPLHHSSGIDLSSLLRGQHDILLELRAMREFAAKQEMIKSIRWGLSNLSLIDQATCVGSLGGVSLPPISLSELVKKVLIEFMKCNGCNVGRRSMISSRDGGEGDCQRFLEQLFDGVFMLTGVAPELVRREDGDYEIYFGDSTV